MTPQELKNSILQLAIQGKLVPQRAEEGNVEDLYQQIQAEKQKLIKEGKIKKEKPLPPITDDEKPFEIPGNWKWVRLGEIGYSNIGLTYSPKDICDSGILVLRSCNIKNSNMNYDDIIKVKMNIPKNKMCKKGDILICARNGSKRLVGKAAVIDRAGMSFGAFMAIFRSQCNEYILNVINSSYFRNIFLEDSGTTTINQITQNMLKNFLTPLPPLAEQKRIVAKIKELLPYVERYETAYNKLQQLNKRFPGDLQKSVLQLAIQGRLVPQRPEEGNAEDLYRQIQAEKQKLIKEGKIKKEKPLPPITDDEKPFEIPETWKWVRLGEVTLLNPKNYLDDNIETSFIPMSLISDGYSNIHTTEIRRWADIKNGFTHFANGDIGVAKITPCFQNKKSVIFTNLENGYGAGTTELSIIRVINNTLLRKYILWFVKADYFISNGVKSFTGTAGQQRIHKDYLKNCLLPLPPFAEQRRIVAKIEELLPLCDKLK